MQAPRILGVIAAVLFINNTTAQALPLEDSGTIATYSINADHAPNQVVIADVAMQEGGTLVIEKKVFDTRNAFTGIPLSSERIVTSLSPATLAMLKEKLSVLSAAEILTTRRDFVCMMIPLFGAAEVLKVRSGFDWQTQQFQGELKVVDNNAGCWQHIAIQPKNDNDLILAKAVEAALEALTIEAVATH